MNWRCIFKGHAWGDWYPWHLHAPRIVKASLEYMNDPTIYRDCSRCGKRQKQLYSQTQINF